jgi:hypothetical protein
LVDDSFALQGLSQRPVIAVMGKSGLNADKIQSGQPVKNNKSDLHISSLPSSLLYYCWMKKKIITAEQEEPQRFFEIKGIAPDNALNIS